MHLEQILRNLENDFGTLSQKTGLKIHCARPATEQIYGIAQQRIGCAMMQAF